MESMRKKLKDISVDQFYTLANESIGGDAGKEQELDENPRKYMIKFIETSPTSFVNQDEAQEALTILKGITVNKPEEFDVDKLAQIVKHLTNSLSCPEGE